MLIALVAIGGAAGAAARYALSGWVHRRYGSGFPWGTLLVNGLGCFLLGAALPILGQPAATPLLRDLLAVGVLGSFTTFSTFAYEGVTLLEDGEWLRAALYLGGSVAVGLLGVAVGLAAAGAG